MPPKGKPQLTEEEMEIITGWIKKGFDFSLKVSSLTEQDTLRLIAVRQFMTGEAVML